MKTISRKTIVILVLSLAMLSLILISIIRFFESGTQTAPQNNLQSTPLQEYVVYENDLYKIRYPSLLTNITEKLDEKHSDIMLANQYTGFAVAVSHMQMSDFILEECVAWMRTDLEGRGSAVTINRNTIKGEEWYEMVFEGVVNDVVRTAFVSFVTAKNGILFDLQFSGPGTIDDLKQYKKIISQIILDFEIK